LSNAQLKQVKIHMSEIGKSLDMFYTDCGFYPSGAAGLKALVTAPAECKNWGPEPYMKAVPVDPWGTEYIYESKGSNYVLKSLGADRQEGGSGKDEDISSEEL
jgi:general secretion pathway protein G